MCTICNDTHVPEWLGLVLRLAAFDSLGRYLISQELVPLFCRMEIMEIVSARATPDQFRPRLLGFSPRSVIHDIGSA